MKTWLSQLLGRVQSRGREVDTLPAVPRAPVWTSQHMIHWRTFLTGPVGQALMARARAVAYVNALEANKDAFHTSHSAGKAAGFHEALLYLESLSLASGDSDAQLNTSMQEPGEIPLHEHYSP